MVTKIAFSIFVLLLAAQRLWELRKSQRNLHRLLSRGGREHNYEHFPAMAFLHGAWLVAMTIETWIFDREIDVIITCSAAIFFIAGQILRLWAMHDLGERWCARIITLPYQPPIKSGIYQFVRHPNYIGVIIEIAAAPMLHNAFMTALIFSVLNLLLLRVRISAEEKALYG